MRHYFVKLGFFIFLAAALLLSSTATARAETAAEIEAKVDAALEKLYATSPLAKEFSGIAKGILVFPEVVKAGVLVGGQYGVGALREGGKTAGYYKTIAVSYGLQAGVQEFGYTLMFITPNALDYLKKSEGWEIGTGPTIVVADKGYSGSLSTTTAKEDIYAFFFDQKGLMAGLGLQGSKISPYSPEK
jgi:lipid-binding SYLF domain-containing protein